MADPITAVGLVTSILGIAGAAISTVTALKEALDALREASNTLSNLTEHIDNVEQLLLSLKATLGPTNDESLPPGLRKCLECLKPSIALLDKACLDFTARLSAISPLSHCKVGTLSKIRLHFEDKQIQIFQNRIECHKSTLGVALNLATYMLSKATREDAHEIKRSITATTSEIGGEIRGLKTAIEFLSPAELGAENQSVVEVLRGEHSTALESCLTACKSAQEAVDGLGTFRVGSVNHTQSARVALAGTVGTVTTRSQGMSVNSITGKDNAAQMVVQEVGADAAQHMFGGFWGSGGRSG